MKEFLTYTLMLTSLITAIILPNDNIWSSLLRGFCIGIFIGLMPVWIRLKNEDSPS